MNITQRTTITQRMTIAKRSKILITVTGLIAALALAAQATGVLASWGDSVWGSSAFGRAEVVEGYARSVTSQAVTDRIWTEGDFRATEATAASQARNIRLLPTAGVTIASTSGTITAFARCTADGSGTVRPTATAPTGGTLSVGNTTYQIPAANASTPINSTAALGSYRVQGTLSSTVTTTDNTALSTLVLDADIFFWGVRTWTVTVQLTRAECGIGVPLPDNNEHTSLTATAADSQARDSEASDEPTADGESTEDEIRDEETAEDGPALPDRLHSDTTHTG